MYHVTIYTDGACSGNPGPGGWGCVLLCGEQRKELNGGGTKDYESENGTDCRHGGFACFETAMQSDALQ